MARPRGTVTITRDRLLSDISRGLTARQIAAKENIHVRAVYATATKFGIGLPVKNEAPRETGK